jgi:hypothetical protein
MRDGVIAVSVYQGTTFQGDINFPILAADACNTPQDCYFCAQSFSNFVCWNATTQGILIGTFVTVIVLFTALLVWLLWKLYCCLNLQFPTWSYVYNMSTDKVEQVPSTFREVAYPKSDSDNISMNSLLFLVILLCFLPQSSAQCTSLGLSSSSIVSCREVSGVLNCTAQLDIEAVLTTLGSKLCGVLISETGFVIGSVNITYTTSNTVGNLQYLYSTSDYNVNIEQHKHCPGASICPSSGGCSSASTTETNLVSAGFSTIDFMYPDYNLCTSSCGCAGCGCIICSSSCLYADISFQPIGETYSVYAITSTYRYPTIKVDLELGGIITHFNITTGEAPITQGDFVFEVLGQLAGDTVIFGDNKIVSNNVNTVWLTPAADYNNPVYNIPGDIQSSTGEGLVVPSSTSFIYPSAPLAFTAAQNSLTFSVPESGISVLSNPAIAKVSPFMVDGSEWTYNGLNLISTDTNPPAVEFSMQTLASTSIQFLVSTVCPSFGSTVIPTMNGCYNCPFGFSISFTAFSTCDDGSALVTISTSSRVQLFTNSILLTGSPSRYILSLSSLDAFVTIAVNISGQYQSVGFTVAGTLQNPPPLTQQQINQIVGNATDTPPITSFSELWNSWSGAGLDGLKWFVAIMFIITSVVTLLTICYAIFYSLHKVRTYYAIPQYDNTLRAL